MPPLVSQGIAGPERRQNMRRKIGSVILAVSILLAWMPDTVMAARMEREPTVASIQKVPDRTENNGNADREKEKGADRDAAALLGGSGSEEDPYRIQDAGQLRLFADMVNGVGGAADTEICAVLTQNIVLSDVCGDGIGSWTPIGTKANPYQGVFDGGSFLISGLYYSNSGASYAGLFGCNLGVIKNLGVAGDVAAGSYTGGVCGFNKGTITGCYSAVSVKGGRYTGGVCGYNDGGSINVCYNTGAVSGSKYVGGIGGYNKNMVADCYNTASVNGSSTSVGGICGYNKKTVSNCYNTGEVSGKGTDYVGSICGYNHSESSFLNSYYLVTGTEHGNYGTGMTRERFASGEVCWLLNGEKSENIVWRQTCGEGFPGFGGETVYQVQAYRGSGSTKELVSWYTNDKSKSGMQTYTAAVESSGDSSGGGSHEHVYQEPEWQWNDDKEADAVFTCQDCGEQITLEASVENKTKNICESDGKIVYKASIEMAGKTYEDTKTYKTEKTGHQSIEPVEMTPATCEKAGIWINCWVCTTCKKYFEDEEGKIGLSSNEVVQPALGHDYVEGAWVWAEDYSSATVDLSCRNCGRTETKKGRAQRKTEAGRTIYTATVQYKGKTYTNSTEPNSGTTLPHTHKYRCESEWEWSGLEKGEATAVSATAVFTCDACGDTKPVSVTEPITWFKSGGTSCDVPGKITYTATVLSPYDGEKYTRTMQVDGVTVPHKYSKDPQWDWPGLEEGEISAVSATATFTCDVCGTPKVETAKNVSVEKPKEASCDTPGQIIGNATVDFQGKTYPGHTEVTIPAGHKLNIYGEAKKATCGEDGNEEYWQCGVCKKLFSDSEGTEQITQVKIIPATGEHSYVKLEGNRHKCSKCNKTFIITEEKDGTTKIYSLEEDAAVIWEPEENDTSVIQSPETAKPDGKTASDGPNAESALEESQEAGGSLPADGQGGLEEQKTQPEQKEQEKQEAPARQTAQEPQGGQTGQVSQDGQGSQPEQENQETQPEQNAREELSGQLEQPVVGEPSGQIVQSEPAAPEEPTEPENGDSVVGTPEDNAHYGLLYPAEEAGKEDPAASDAFEESLVNLRAESAANIAVQRKEEQAGGALWICIVALAVFTGMLLILILRKKESSQ